MRGREAHVFYYSFGYDNRAAIKNRALWKYLAFSEALTFV